MHILFQLFMMLLAVVHYPLHAMVHGTPSPPLLDRPHPPQSPGVWQNNRLSQQYGHLVEASINMSMFSSTSIRLDCLSHRAMEEVDHLVVHLYQGPRSGNAPEPRNLVLY